MTIHIELKNGKSFDYEGVAKIMEHGVFLSLRWYKDTAKGDFTLNTEGMESFIIAEISGVTIEL